MLNASQINLIRNTLRDFVDTLLIDNSNEHPEYNDFLLSTVKKPNLPSAEEVLADLQEESLQAITNDPEMPPGIRATWREFMQQFSNRGDIRATIEELKNIPSYSPQHLCMIQNYYQQIRVNGVDDPDVIGYLVRIRELFLGLTPMHSYSYGEGYMRFSFRLGSVPLGLDRLGDQPSFEEISEVVSEYISERVEQYDEIQKQVLASGEVAALKTRVEESKQELKRNLVEKQRLLQDLQDLKDRLSHKETVEAEKNAIENELEARERELADLTEKNLVLRLEAAEIQRLLQAKLVKQEAKIKKLKRRLVIGQREPNRVLTMTDLEQSTTTSTPVSVIVRRSSLFSSPAEAQLLTREDSDLQEELITACEKGQVDVVQTLIEKGADLYRPNSEDKLPLGAAIWGCNRILIDFLEEQMQDITAEYWQKCVDSNIHIYGNLVPVVRPFDASCKTFVNLYDCFLNHGGKGFGMYSTYYRDRSIMDGVNHEHWIENIEWSYSTRSFLLLSLFNKGWSKVYDSNIATTGFGMRSMNWREQHNGFIHVTETIANFVKDKLDCLSCSSSDGSVNFSV